MKLTKAEQEICKKYRKRDSKGLVHCFERPLMLDERALMCKAIATKKDIKELAE